MGTLAISAANLDTLENNILVLNDNINSVTGEIININGQINNVNEDVSTVKESVRTLEQEIRDFMSEIRGTTVVANAQNDILLKENELNNKYGNYSTIRTSVKGLLDSVNMNIVSRGTLKTESEKVLMVAPHYYLSYALLAISCWFNNDKVGANKALNEALKLNDKKTSLLLSLVHTKLGRVATSYKWMKRYLSSQDSHNLDYDFMILLDAYSENVFDFSINELIQSEIKRYINETGYDDVIVDGEVERFRTFFSTRKSENKKDYYYLSRFSNNHSNIVEAVENSDAYYDAYFAFDDLLSSNKYNTNKSIDSIISNLLESYDKEELSLRQNILKDDLIIKYKGDSSIVDREYNSSKIAYEYTNNIYTIFTNILLNRSSASVSSKRIAVSYLKDIIKKGLDKALPTSNMGDTVISINDYSGTTTDGSNENELIKDMLAVIKKPYDAKAKALSFINIKSILSIAGIIMGIVLAFTSQYFIGLAITLISIGVLIYFIFSNLNEKDRLMKEYEEVSIKYKDTLENTLAELVDVTFTIKRAKKNYDYIINYLNGFEVK